MQDASGSRHAKLGVFARCDSPHDSATTLILDGVDIPPFQDQALTA